VKIVPNEQALRERLEAVEAEIQACRAIFDRVGASTSGWHTLADHCRAVVEGQQLWRQRALKLEAEKANPWLRCDQRMPEHGAKVWAYSPAENGYAEKIWDATYSADEGWWLTGSEQVVRVTHWMPKSPVPPKDHA